jgi:hypothetical protein
MRSPRNDDFRFGDALLDPTALAVDEHGIDETLGAARGDDATHLLAGMVLLDCLSVEHRRRHGDDLGLQFGGAGIHVALDDVGVSEESVALGEEAIVIVIAVVDRARDMTGIADAVLLPRHHAQLLEDALP